MCPLFCVDNVLKGTDVRAELRSELNYVEYMYTVFNFFQDCVCEQRFTSFFITSPFKDPLRYELVHYNTCCSASNRIIINLKALDLDLVCTL